MGVHVLRPDDVALLGFPLEQLLETFMQFQPVAAEKERQKQDSNLHDVQDLKCVKRSKYKLIFTKC